MWKRSLAKTNDEVQMDLIAQYKRDNSGPCRMEDVAQWIIDNGLLPLPRISPLRLLTRNLKQTARRRRRKDSQDRTVREMIAAKTERIDAGGNRVFDVMWDFLASTSVDHAFTSFLQRDEVIEKQRLAATRDVHSFLDNNPNAAGYESQFVFDFMLEERAEQRQEKIEESKIAATQPRTDEESRKPKPR